MSQTLKTLLAPYSTAGFCNIWYTAQDAIRLTNRTDVAPHYWHRMVTARYHLHPIILRLVEEYEVRPADWQRLLLEWPHVSNVDKTQIAYTRSEEHGLDFIDNGDKRQTRTAIGKYLARHYPHIPDHIRRDIAGLYAAPDYKIWSTMEEIICGIELGPQSCMRSSYGSIPFSDEDNLCLTAWYNGDKDVEVNWDHHPYRVYDPQYGWGMAVQIDKGKPDVVVSRALVWHDPREPNRKGFVRSYVARTDWSDSDHTLEAWLREQGYTKWNRWPDGAKLARVQHPDGGDSMMPYIDGGVQTVTDMGDHYIIEDGGDIECCETDGTMQRNEGEPCDDCGDNVREHDDRYWVGRHEDRLICSCCIDEYRWVVGSRSSYYVRDDDAVEVSGEHYDVNNLPSYIIEIDGEYYHTDDVIEINGEYYPHDSDEIIEIDGEWYLKDGDDVVKCADGDYRLKDDCWECAHSNEWYPNDEPCVDLTDGTYHPDSLRELADNA